MPIQWYHPGYKAGGLIQALRRINANLKENFQIYVLTTDRDLGSSIPYTNITADVWLPMEEGVQVKYLSKEKTSYRQIAKEIKNLNPDIIYLKSIFNPRFSLYVLWYLERKQHHASIILAPSGMLRQSSLLQKWWKKYPTLMMLRRMRTIRNIQWHATDQQECKDIQKHFGKNIRLSLLSEFPPPVMENIPALEKKPILKLLFLSRIHPVKNLLFLLRILQKVKSPVKLSIAGPIEDEQYWATCQKLLARLPSHISTSYLGDIPQNKVAPLFQEHHLFALPTIGEGFGNVILEAMANACPVLISDQTPWRNLLKYNAGRDIPLEKPEAFVSAIESFAGMEQAEYDLCRKAALAYAENIIDVKALKKNYVKMFLAAKR